MWDKKGEIKKCQKLIKEYGLTVVMNNWTLIQYRLIGVRRAVIIRKILEAERG